MYSSHEAIIIIIMHFLVNVTVLQLSLSDYSTAICSPIICIDYLLTYYKVFKKYFRVSTETAVRLVFASTSQAANMVRKKLTADGGGRLPC